MHILVDTWIQRCEDIILASKLSPCIVMWAPLTLYAKHAVFAIIQNAKTTLTTLRMLGYEVILSPPSVKVVDSEGDVHHCATCIPNESSQATEDPIPGSIVYFVDGCSTIDQHTGVRSTGAAVVGAQQHVSSDTFHIVEQLILPAHYSSQAAELIALIVALK